MIINKLNHVNPYCGKWFKEPSRSEQESYLDREVQMRAQKQASSSLSKPSNTMVKIILFLISIKEIILSGGMM